MIIKIFNNVGKGSSKGPINYLLGKDSNGKEREPAPAILAGCKEAVAFLIDNNHRANKYTSGVIAFRDDERPTAPQIKELLQDFRKTFLPGLDEDRAPVLIVRHLEKGNLELHFLIAKQDSKTGKALNIAPPGPASQKLFEDFQKIQNDKLDFKQVKHNLLKAQFDVFEKKTRKVKIGNHLIDKVKRNELHTYSDLLRHLEQDLKIRVTKRGRDFITVQMPGKSKPVKLKGPAFTPGADLKELLKKSSDQPDKLTPEKKEEIQKSLSNGIQARASYNNKTYNSPPKSRALNFKSNSKLSKTSLTKTKLDMPKVATSNSIKNFEELPPVPVAKTAPVDVLASTHTNPSTQQKTSSNSLKSGSSGSGGGSGGGVSSLDSQIALVKSQMNNEKNPGKRAALHAQLMGLQVKKEIQARQQHNDELKRINKIRP